VLSWSRVRASVVKGIFGRGPLADWPSGAITVAICLVLLVFVLLADLTTQGEITIGGLGVIVLLGAALALSRRLVIVVLAAAVMLRVVSATLGGVYLATALTQIAAYLVVAGLSFLAADSMRAARENATRADRLRKVVEAGVDFAGKSSSPQEWVEKLMVFSVQAVDADRGNVSRFEGDEMVVEASYDREEPPLEVGSRWKIASQPLAADLLQTKMPVQGVPAEPGNLAPELVRTLRRIRHYLLVPLIYEDSVHGMIALARFREPAFPPEAVESVEQVAHMASLALRSARLYSDLNGARLASEAAISRLMKRERQLADAQSIAHLGSYEYNLARDEITWSPEIYRIFGRDPSPGTLSLSDWLQAVHPDDREATLKVVDEARRTPKGFSIEYRIVRSDRQIRTLQSIGRVVVDETNRPVALAGTAQDLTDLKRAEQQSIALTHEREEQLLQHARRMEALDKVKTEFLLLVSHELRGPLAVLNGYVSLLQDGTLGELSVQAKDVLPTMSEQGNAIKGLIDEMLQTARLEEAVELDLEPMDLRDVVAAAIKSTAQVKSAEARMEVAMPDERLPVLADRDRLTRVVSALLDNAIKYSSPRSAVTCTTEVEDRWAVIVVRDRGYGIKSEDMPRLFTRFGRIVSADNAHIPGTGLGLYLAQRFANMHGGRITVESEPGEGSAFELRIPMAADVPVGEDMVSVLATSR
jgi:signal transduction histidine kinase